jgi:hypothetical protein
MFIVDAIRDRAADLGFFLRDHLRAVVLILVLVGAAAGGYLWWQSPASTALPSGASAADQQAPVELSPLLSAPCAELVASLRARLDPARVETLDAASAVALVAEVAPIRQVCAPAEMALLDARLVSGIRLLEQASGSRILPR